MTHHLLPKATRRRFCAAVMGLAGSTRRADGGRPRFVCVCSPRNDLFQLLRAIVPDGPGIIRHDQPGEAIAAAAPGDVVLLLAKAEPLVFEGQWVQEVRQKRLRVYAEYCAWRESIAPKVAEWERIAVVSDLFGAKRRNKILTAHRCHYLPAASAGTVHLRLARIAGYDDALFGVPETATPLLYEPEPGFLIAGAALSNFRTGRYAPTESWRWIWQGILKHLTGSASRVPDWKPRLNPSYGPREPLPAGAERQAVERGVAWYSNARLLVHPTWQNKLEEARYLKDRVGPAPLPDWPLGDGNLGLIEGHASEILPDGRQNARWWVRADCVGETAMTLAVAQGDSAVARNLLDYLFGKTQMSLGLRSQPERASYGLMGWIEGAKYREEVNPYDVYYGDDNARCLLGAIAAEACCRRTVWAERIWKAVLANFRVSGRLGHRNWRHDEAPLQEKGWRYFYEQEETLHDMNYQAYPWALFLWAYQQTGYRPFLDRTALGMRLTMEAYPSKWRCTNSMTMEQARLLLPLAWLVRVSDTPEHRGWLRRISSDLLQSQHRSGAIAERLAGVENGVQMPPTSNEKYGTSEGTLIQHNGDPAADLLYTVNFALIGLHEAAAATGDSGYAAAVNRLAEFVVRCQVKAESSLKQLDGAWFRAFDFERWDYWSSSSDAGWGAWCTEAGWSQSWLTTTLALRTQRRSLWEIATAPKTPESLFARLRLEMLPNP